MVIKCTTTKSVYYDSYVSHKMGGRRKNCHKLKNFAFFEWKDEIFRIALSATVIWYHRMLPLNNLLFYILKRIN